ncbi:MAG: four helix bundle protein [Anaerolineales bacterium]|nr:four helix bundle protein [Anaerolineales bacterium]
MKDFRGLKVWEKAHALALQVYGVSAAFPKTEMFGLTSQMRRASASIPSNLAEGCGRRTDNDLGRFVVIAMGSASELEYQLLLSRDLGYLSGAGYEDLAGKVVEVKRMLAALVRRLTTDGPKHAVGMRSAAGAG